MIGVAFVLASLAGLAGPLSPRLTNTFGSKAAGQGLLLLSALCMGVLACTHAAALSVALVALLCTLSALFSPLSAALENGMITVPDRATALSVNAMVRDGVVVTLDLALGRAADAGLPLALGVCAAGCMLACGLFTLYARRAR